MQNLNYFAHVPKKEPGHKKAYKVLGYECLDCGNTTKQKPTLCSICKSEAIKEILRKDVK
jgi:predicted Zn-ribbon and HTH transcriptional regulator